MMNFPQYRMTRSLSFLLPIAATLVGCSVASKISIHQPARGAMLAPSAQNQAAVEAPSDTIRINGKAVSGGSPFSVDLPEVNGLGFAVAEIPGDPLVAVRSWHQGEFLPKDKFHTDTMIVTLGHDVLSSALSKANTSVARLIEELLVDADLSQFISDPIKATVGLIPVTVTVRSAAASKVAVGLDFKAPHLSLRARLEDVQVQFKAKSIGLPVGGTAIYRAITITGDLSVSNAGVTLINPVVDIPDPDIDVSIGLIDKIATQVAKQFRDAIPPTVEQAAQAAAQTVFSRLIADLKPSLAVHFAHPLAQETQIQSIAVNGQSLILRYATKIRAQAPRLAKNNHGVLARTTPATNNGPGLFADIGPALLNQYAFATWDAGNLHKLVFTQKQLEQLGLPELQFPYSKLNKVTITLRLPPLLEWGAEGARFDVGGIEMDIDVATVGDMKAWTAARTPVVLTQTGKSELRLKPDTTRPPTILDVEFDQLNQLANHQVVLELMRAAVPGVVERVFGDLPTIQIPSFQLKRLDGQAGRVIQPQIKQLTRGANGWILGISLVAN